MPCHAVPCRAIVLLLGVMTQALLSCGKACQQNSHLTHFSPQLPLKVESARLCPAGDHDTPLGPGPPCQAQDGGLSTNHPRGCQAEPSRAKPGCASGGDVQQHWVEAVAAAPAMQLPGLSSLTVAPVEHLERGSAWGCHRERGPGYVGMGWRQELGHDSMAAHAVDALSCGLSR